MSCVCVHARTNSGGERVSVRACARAHARACRVCLCLCVGDGLLAAGTCKRIFARVIACVQEQNLLEISRILEREGASTPQKTLRSYQNTGLGTQPSLANLGILLNLQKTQTAIKNGSTIAPSHDRRPTCALQSSSIFLRS